MTAPMATDAWQELMSQVRAGDWVCATHGVITPVATPVVPACPRCSQIPTRVVFDRRGVIGFVEPTPTHCAGEARHPLGPDRVLLSWVGCQCRTGRDNHGGHRTWTCRACADRQLAPACANPPR